MFNNWKTELCGPLNPEEVNHRRHNPVYVRAFTIDDGNKFHSLTMCPLLCMYVCIIKHICK